MDWQKTLNLVAIGVVAWLLLIQWDQFDSTQSQAAAPSASQAIGSVDQSVSSELPAVEVNTGAELPELMNEMPIELTPATANSRLVLVATDVFEVKIDTLGGDIVEVRLLEHLTAMPEDGGQPFMLLNRLPNSTYVAQSGLIGKNGTDTADGRPRYRVTSNSYQMMGGD